MSERSTFIPSTAPPKEPIWPERFLHVIKERDRAREIAVALEQENAVLRNAISLELDSRPPGRVPSVLDVALAMFDRTDQEEA